ncbi:TIGR04282 family arsenosugar biosynthesis glycosyltransferase [Leisingera caerulea]|uniref:TIGR04282 family arsenosugar biosynthesis glycosyltransferase n=1 Tax=Leisingera caerulea TaxID=506591 RepID=UPI0021A3B448|nr:TIGR04282 family arsenosugar biosynthesis glycosyltransferase [Leisingera caerulea]UWQ62696.1 TIGR04282 family arsenosugar biosynthesis glycosyltransferase [Leisingera caerulea]
MKRTLIIMVKEPRPGRVKTRLGRDIGRIPATWWFRHQSARLIRSLRDPRWQIVLAVAPDTAVFSKAWPADIPRLPQGNGDLGARMKRALSGLPSRQKGPVCLIGADIPGITRAHTARAFSALGSHDAVFGPAADGGYWLVGVKHPARMPRGLFENTRWSTEHALADTLRTLPGWRIALTDTLQDVDTAADLPRR